MTQERVEITECPRDAMQGIKEFIPTDKKVAYLNQLLKVGFSVLDFGSFVSPKAIPQMQDTHEVLAQLNTSSSTKLLAIVANERGANDAAAYAQITYLGYPFSVSETFQQRNTNASIAESLDRVKEIQDTCLKNNKQLLIYLSMAFGNPYGDEWNADLVTDWAMKISDLGIKHIALADTIGVSTPENIHQLFSTIIPALPNTEIGAHLHALPNSIEEKLSAAWHAGCRKFDGAIKGYGGCPMAKDELTGNMATEVMVSWFEKNQIQTSLNKNEFQESIGLSGSIF